MALTVNALCKAREMLRANEIEKQTAVGMTHAQCAKLNSVDHADFIWAQHPHHPKSYPLIFWPDGRTTVM